MCPLYDICFVLAPKTHQHKGMFGLTLSLSFALRLMRLGGDPSGSYSIFNMVSIRMPREPEKYEVGFPNLFFEQVGGILFGSFEFGRIFDVSIKVIDIFGWHSGANGTLDIVASLVSDSDEVVNGSSQLLASSAMFGACILAEFKDIT